MRGFVQIGSAETTIAQKRIDIGITRNEPEVQFGVIMNGPQVAKCGIYRIRIGDERKGRGIEGGEREGEAHGFSSPRWHGLGPQKSPASEVFTSQILFNFRSIMYRPRMSFRSLALSLSLVVALVPKSAQAADAVEPRMQVNFPVDLTISGAGAAIWLTTEILKSKIAPSSCHWCEPPSGDLAVKNALRWDNTKNADVASYVTGFALAPIAALGLDAASVYSRGGSFREWGEDATVIVESIVVAANLNQLVKFTVGRERPFVHDLAPGEKSLTKSPGDNNLSFYSGHTMLGFVSAVSAGTVASLKGYRSAPWIWGTGLTLAAATGYLRIAADKHYFTDVLTGAIMGSAAGFLVPWLHRPKTTTARVTGMAAGPLPAGTGTIITFQGILP